MFVLLDELFIFKKKRKKIILHFLNKLKTFSGYLNLGYSTPFISLDAAYMYTSVAAAKAAVIFVGEEIATNGLPSGICPLVFVFL